MQFSELLTVLGIQNGALDKGQFSISTTDLTANIDELIRYCWLDQPISMQQASVTAIDEKANSVTVSGKSSFLSVPDLATTATFHIDADDQVQTEIRFAVLPEFPGANNWKFSKSFPGMPKVQDADGAVKYDRSTGVATITEVYPLDDHYF
ncbi:MAG: hypothetical protein AAF570_19085, partial [Bacteroidota bacterium]